MTLGVAGETEFLYSRGIRQGGVEAPVLCGRVAKYVLWKAEEKWKTRGWKLSLGGKNDSEHVLRGMMWADNCWLFCGIKERLVCMVNDIIEELLDLDMEPKPESLWWTTTYTDEGTATLRVGSRGVMGRGLLQGQDGQVVAHQVEEDGSPVADRKSVDKKFVTMNWAVYDGDVPIMRALRSILGWRNTARWRNRSAWRMATDPNNEQRWKHKFGFHNRGVQGYPDVEVGRQGKDWIQRTAQGPQGRRDVRSTRDDETSGGKRTEKGGIALTKKPRDLAPLVLEVPTEDKKLILEIRGDSKTIVDWVNG